MATATIPQSQPQPQSSLIGKLAEACDAVGGIEKKGRNEFQRYNYVKAADVAKAIRHELFSRGILVIIDEKEWVEERKIKTNSGGEVPLMRLKGEVSFRDEHEILGPFGAFATAFDSGDKAIYKAKTGLLKYALRSIGLIPDEKDDPEADPRTDEETAENLTAMPKRNGKRKTIAAYQAQAWYSACDQNGKTATQQAHFLKERFAVNSIMEVDDEQMTEAVRWAFGKEPLEKTLVTSAQVVRRAKAPQPVVDAMDQRVHDEFTGD